MISRAAGAVLAAAMMLAATGVHAAGLGLSYAAYRMNQPAVTPVREGEVISAGEKLLIKIKYINRESTAASAGAVIFTLPEGCAFVTAERASNLAVSVDGGYRFGPLATLRVWRQGRWRPAVGADVTHVRLTLDRPVAPGEQGEVSIVAARS